MIIYHAIPWYRSPLYSQFLGKRFEEKNEFWTGQEALWSSGLHPRLWRPGGWRYESWWGQKLFSMIYFYKLNDKDLLKDSNTKKMWTGFMLSSGRHFGAKAAKLWGRVKKLVVPSRLKKISGPGTWKKILTLKIDWKNSNFCYHSLRSCNKTKEYLQSILISYGKLVTYIVGVRSID